MTTIYEFAVVEGKLPMRASPVFVNDVFVDRVRDAGLRTVSFRPRWTSGGSNLKRTGRI